MILHEKQIKANIAHLKCGNSQGTAFLISSNQAITAFHCIEEYSENIPIELNFKDTLNPKIIKATPINMMYSFENDLDIIVLELEYEVLHQEYLELSQELLSNQSSWKTFGYPQIESIDGIFLEGKILYEKRQDTPENYDLVVQTKESITNTEGMSGSPLIVDGKVYGIISYDRNKRNSLGVVSIKKAIKIFETLKINIQKEKSTKVEVIENDQTEQIILDCIANYSGGYLFFKGAPGSGKTTFIHNFNNKIKNIDILGKYFLKGIDEKYNIQYNSNKEVLGRWLLDNISKYLYNDLYSEQIDSDFKLIKAVINHFNQLSIEAKKTNKKIIIFLDGIDEMLLINKEQINKFFSIFPNNLKENIYIIISGNNETLIPPNIKLESILNIAPLDLDKVTLYIEENLIIENKNLILINKLAEKSEGNPLYLKYLIDEINLNKELTEEHISSVPAFSGNIKNYYEIFWGRICNNFSLIKILALIARARKGISKTNLEQMLSIEEKGTFTNNFSLLNHLISYKKDHLKIYHTSFENFIKEKTLNTNDYFHEIIANFCLNNKNNIYSLENKLYHLLNGKEDIKKEALKNCNQEWLDSCSIEHIDLGLMLEDIKNVLDYSMDVGEFSEIIRILLLIERLTFRNEKLFKVFSVEISKALFEIDKGKYILNYLLKDEKLQVSVSNIDSIYFLHRLFKNKFYNEGNQLLRAIEKRCIEAFENKKINAEILFLDLTSAMYKDTQLAFVKLEYYNSILKKSSPNDYKEIIEYLSACLLAFLMNKSQSYPDLETLHLTFGTKHSQDSISFISEIILQYIFLQEQSYINKKNTGLEKAVEDLEFLINEYSPKKDSKAILALINFSENIKLLEKLIKNENEPIFDIRAHNNVDFNFNDYFNFKNYWMFQGYCGFSLNKKNYSNWEEFILIKIKEINIILGKCLRKKAERNTNEFSEIYANILEILNELKFSFSDRVNWERSYHIPETIIPQLYKEIAYIYSNFFETKLNDLNVILFNNYQLGLYNEGYRRSLFNVSVEIIKNETYKEEAFEILNRLDDVIDKYVLNRWERNCDFLELIKLYGQLGAKEIAESTFKKMLSTSMGPTWYKEDQLTLMPTGIKHLNNLSHIEEYVGEILGNLDYASGEMTFQRYVRDAKEDMAGVMGKFINKNLSLEYLKRKINPPYDELLTHLKEDSFDMLDDSNSYIQGTNEIDIQDSMYSFIIEQESVDPLIKFAIAEIFLQGDERYFNDYSILQIKILKESQINSIILYNKLTSRIKRQFVVELDPPRRNIFLKILEKEITLISLATELKELNLPIEVTKESFSETNNIMQDTEEEPILSLAKREIKFGNKNSVKKMLKDRLIDLQNKNGDVFFYSNESSKCLDLLQELCSSENELISHLKYVCLNNYDLGWRTAYHLLKRAGGYLQKDDANNTMKEILKHMELVLRTPKNYSKRYEWIKNQTSSDHPIEEYIIWLMNLPSEVIYTKKATEILIWLATEHSLVIIPLLIKESLKEKKEKSSEASASILYAISKTKVLETVWYSIIVNYNLKESILKETHFMIKSYYYEITKLAKKFGLLQSEEYLQEIEKSLFNQKITTIKSKINWDLYLSSFNKSTIFCLKEMEKSIGIDSSFINKLIAETKSFIAPLTLDQLEGINKVLERSYFLPDNLVNISTEEIKIVINLILEDWITLENYNDLKTILRSHNPYFPENNYCLNIPNLHSNLNKFILQKINFNDTFLYHNNKLILHYDEIVANYNKRKGDRIEITAFLIEESKSIPSSEDKLYDIFYSNQEPEEAILKVDNQVSVIPLVHKCTYFSCKNNWNTPSTIHPNFMKETSINIQDTERLNWRSGTILNVDGFGIPIQEGRLLSIDKKYLSQIKNGYKLMYIVRYNIDEKLFFIDLKNKIIKGWR